MKSLQELTRDVFQSYSKYKTDKSFNWNKLSDDRKSVWLSDVNYLLVYLLDELEKELKVKPINKAPKASYELGYVRGSETEKQRIRDLVFNMKKKFEKDHNNS